MYNAHGTVRNRDGTPMLTIMDHNSVIPGVELAIRLVMVPYELVLRSVALKVIQTTRDFKPLQAELVQTQKQRELMRLVVKLPLRLVIHKP